MHRNLRPPDVAQVVLNFNYEARDNALQPTNATIPQGMFRQTVSNALLNTIAGRKETPGRKEEGR